jgi:hypothetical protein
MRINLSASLLIMCTLPCLNGCGFIMEPLGYSATLVAQGAVKGADAGIHYGAQAAKTVTETASTVASAAKNRQQATTVSTTDTQRTDSTQAQ